MAVAAAIGVGPEDPMSGGGASGPVGQRGLPATGNNALSQRLSNKMKLMPNHPAAALGALLGGAEVLHCTQISEVTNITIK